MLNTFTYTHLHATDRSEFPNNFYSRRSGSKWIWIVLHFTCYFFSLFYIYVNMFVLPDGDSNVSMTITLAHSVLNNIQWSRKEHYKSITAHRKAMW